MGALKRLFKVIFVILSVFIGTVGIILEIIYYSLRWIAMGKSFPDVPYTSAFIIKVLES